MLQRGWIKLFLQVFDLQVYATSRGRAIGFKELGTFHF